MLRSVLLFLSGQRHLRKWVETSHTAQRFSQRFVAGENLDDALLTGHKLNSEGIRVTLDHLGESVTSLAEAANARDVYLRTLAAIHENKICGNVSLKLTQFGLDLSETECRANVARLAEQAARLGNFVYVDMESSAYTERTIRLVEDLHAQYGSVGTVIQAYLYRSRKDIENLCARRIRVRLCKGAYLEHASVAFPRKADVDRNYVELMKLLLDQGEYPAIATHDERIIEQTKAYMRGRGIAADRFEFQMLYGIGRDLQRRLVSEGYRLRLYVPFGKAWYPYFMRRLAERPANLIFLARNLFRR
ncbi:MAG TPA: proline dehydrogenase family protein [Bryobacteraceae bacterium]|nr:proline dehydrogenase family protein [Bryobacteraceae bacterium]